MAQFKLEDEFEKSLITLLNSKENFFLVRLPSNESLKINIDASGCDWVLKYKYNLIEQAKKLKTSFKIQVTDEVFAFFYYFYKFVMPDILILNKFLPNKADQILDIGAGIGLFEVFLNNLYRSKSNVSIIEVNDLLEIEHHKKEKETKKLSSPLHVLNLAKKFLDKNNISNINLIDSKHVYNKLDKPYNLVISLRSWGYLFKLDEYLDFVTSNLASDGVVIVDINKRTLCRSKFEENFKNTKIIKEYVAHTRLIGNKK